MRYLFWTIWICWFLSEIFLNRVFRSKRVDSGDADKNSLRWIWFAIIASISCGVVIRFSVTFPIIRSAWLSYTGLMLIVIGMTVRFIAIRTLGKFFTVDLSIHESHELIHHGLYSGSLLSFLGFSLSLNNWFSLIIIFIPVLISFLYRIKIEESLLVDQFGKEYKDYIKKTGKLIPLIY